MSTSIFEHNSDYTQSTETPVFFSFLKTISDEEEDEEDLPDHVDLGLILPKLSNLTHLELCFAVKDVGMNFEWGFFTFTLKDADMLGKSEKKNKFKKSTGVVP